MKRAIIAGLAFLTLVGAPALGHAQNLTGAQQVAQEKATIERLSQYLARVGPLEHIDFKQGVKVPNRFGGDMKQGLKYCDSLEVWITVGHDNTIRVEVFPHVNGHYLNIDKARDRVGMMKQMLHFNDTNFYFWGADSEGDVFAKFIFQLGSGFPTDSLNWVMDSIVANDLYAQQLSYFM
jgi:hypothetical protein